MKLARILSINNKAVPLVDDRVLLKLNAPGSAQFTFDATKTRAEPGQAVSFDLGYTRHESISRLFLGYVENAVDMDARRQRILCRELANVLRARVPLNLRHVSARDVMTEVNDKIGLNFSLPAAAYSDERKPNFYNLGDGFEALRGIGRVYDIDDFIWQQQGGGILYVGSWSDSRYADKPVELPKNLFDGQLSSNTLRVAAIPAMRPGVLVNGLRITRLEFSDNHMMLTWTKP